MARSVRKVSRVSTKNQKKENSGNKSKLIIIITTILVVLVSVGVGLGIYFSLKGNSNNVLEGYQSDKIYFVEPVVRDGKTLTFTKDNYQSLNWYCNFDNDNLDYESVVEHRFIFVYDGTQFYADEEMEDADKKIYQYEEYVKLISRLEDLLFEIDEVNQQGNNSVSLTIVDVSVDGGTNQGILTDANYGRLGDGYPAFIYLHDNKFESTFQDQKDVISVGGSSWKTIASSAIPFTLNYLESLK